jgi:hypothetical protein
MLDTFEELARHLHRRWHHLEPCPCHHASAPWPDVSALARQTPASAAPAAINRRGRHPPGGSDHQPGARLPESPGRTAASGDAPPRAVREQPHRRRPQQAQSTAAADARIASTTIRADGRRRSFLRAELATRPLRDCHRRTRARPASDRLRRACKRRLRPTGSGHLDRRSANATEPPNQSGVPLHVCSATSVRTQAATRGQFSRGGDTCSLGGADGIVDARRRSVPRPLTGAALPKRREVAEPLCRAYSWASSKHVSLAWQPIGFGVVD